jgi:hypothetical protein
MTIKKEPPDQPVLVYEGEWITQIPEVIIKAGVLLSPGAFRLWTVLRYFAGRKDEAEKSCFPGIEAIADMMGISPRNIQHYQNELVAVKLLIVERRVRKVGWGVINHYTMLDPELWWRQTGKALKKIKKLISQRKLSITEFSPELVTEEAS